MGNLAKVLGMSVFLKLGVGYAIQLLLGLLPRRAPQSYEEYIIHRFGRPAYKLVFEPLAEKVWGTLSLLHPDMARTRIPTESGLDIILKLLKLKEESSDTDADFFYYPKKGFGDWPLALNEKIEEFGGKTVLNANITGLKTENDVITSVATEVNGEKISYPCDYLVSSIPLPVLGKMIFHDENEQFSNAITGLHFRHLILVYLYVNKAKIFEDQWIFLPESDYIFGRVFEQKQMNPDLGPADSTVICCDLTCPEEGWQWDATDQ